MSVASPSSASASLEERILDLLPQTQCTKCGYEGCRPYAAAIAKGEAAINQCPPGGSQGIARLAQLLGRPVIALNPENGVARSRPVALIDEKQCIGCTLCIQACPVDAIVGAAKLMHTVLPDVCTGCDLCVAPCPVDCITMEARSDVPAQASGWDVWSPDLAQAARTRYEARQARLLREKKENEARLAAKAVAKLAAVEQEQPVNEAEAAEKARKRAIIEAALARARAKQAKPEGEA
ncbi:electron transport complex subunit RsxB [Massilia sp. W12]|uniref:electron transport complex subunit RsxB n=1 Tax=Massilia sp. W12 TaxID=3126507 RepID=UPI0030D60B9C